MDLSGGNGDTTCQAAREGQDASVSDIKMHPASFLLCLMLPDCAWVVAARAYRFVETSVRLLLIESQP